VVVAAQQQGLISTDTAASYLQTSVDRYTQEAKNIQSIYQILPATNT
jgi:hypothetical protein